MKYYVNTDGKRYAYPDDYTKIPAGITPITEAEARQAVADEQEAYKLTDEYRLSANQAYLASTDWVCAKCYELGVAVAEKYPEIYEARTAARQAISDIQEAADDDTNE